MLAAAYTRVDDRETLAVALGGQYVDAEARDLNRLPPWVNAGLCISGVITIAFDATTGWLSEA